MINSLFNILLCVSYVDSMQECSETNKSFEYQAEIQTEIQEWCVICDPVNPVHFIKKLNGENCSFF